MAYYFEYDFDGKESIDDYAKPAVDLITSWQKADGSAVLEGHIEPDELLVVDTRFETRSEYRLKGIEHQLYIFCDETRSRSSMLSAFPDVSPAAIDRCLQLFVSTRLMAFEGNSFLSLAVLQGEAMSKIEPLPKQLTVLG
jgi:hypothetical protein